MAARMVRSQQGRGLDALGCLGEAFLLGVAHREVVVQQRLRRRELETVLKGLDRQIRLLHEHVHIPDCGVELADPIGLVVGAANGELERFWVFLFAGQSERALVNREEIVRVFVQDAVVPDEGGVEVALVVKGDPFPDEREMLRRAVAGRLRRRFERLLCGTRGWKRKRTQRERRPAQNRPPSHAHAPPEAMPNVRGSLRPFAGTCHRLRNPGGARRVDPMEPETRSAARDRSWAHGDSPRSRDGWIRVERAAPGPTAPRYWLRGTRQEPLVCPAPPGWPADCKD